MTVVKIPYEEYIAIYGKVPRLCVDLIIRDGERILFSLRDIDPGKGSWHFPGGTVLMGESLSDAVRRIAKEETGLVVTDPVLLGTMEFHDEQNLFYHTVSLVFEVRSDGEGLTGSFQGQQLRYFHTMPQNLIHEQEVFLNKHKLIETN